jgi:O-antigen/teichoic acid export membrane protein
VVSLSGDGERTLPHTRTVAVVATTLASVVSRLASLASQVIVGVFLTDAQVGEYAAALGIIGITGIWRNGGAATYFPSVKPMDFDRMSGSLFAWASMFGTATALLTIGFGLSLTHLPTEYSQYQGSAFSWVLLLLATRAVVHPVALLGRSRLSVCHQFTGLARTDAALAVFRIVLTWIVAREGGGALALAIPYVAGSAAEAIAFGLMGGYRASDFRLSSWSFRDLWPMLAWPLVMAVLNSLRGEASYLLIGLAIPASALGMFYFAFQLANQPTMLIGGALQNVLAPIVARDRGAEVAERSGIERIFASAMLFTPITTMAAASFFPAAERLLWNGKWAEAITSLYFLCVASTYTTVSSLLVGPLVGLQRFKAAAGFEFLKFVGMMLGILAGAVIVHSTSAGGLWGMSSITVVSAFVAIGMAISALAQILWVAKAYRIAPADATRHLLFGPALSALTAIAATSLASSLVTSLGIHHDRTGAFWELVIISVTYAVLICLAVRFTAESTLRDSLAALPKPAGDRLRRLLYLH